MVRGGDGATVEAAVLHRVDVVEQVRHPDLGMAALLGVQGRVDEQVGDLSIGAHGVERRQAEGDDLAAVHSDDVVRLVCAGHKRVPQELHRYVSRSRRLRCCCLAALGEGQ